MKKIYKNASEKLLVLSLLLTFTLPQTIYGQSESQSVSGVVTDDSDAPIPGVNVLVKDSDKGTITDVEGKFSLTVEKQNPVLIFSFIGYQTKEIEVGSQSEINVSLISDTKELSEVIVTALGVEREERSLGYAVQEVNTEGIDQAKETNIVNSLTGKIAGVQISNSSGNIGGSSRILIRGINSISGNNQPLFVVDGTPIDNSNYNTGEQSVGDGGRDYGNAAQDINPDDIASISVLKGPSAAALYGNRAANGVILITTKSGKLNEGIGVSINSTTSFSNAFILPEMQNEYGGGFKLTFDEYTNAAGETFKIVNTNANNTWGPRFEGQMVRHWDSMYPGEPNYEEVRPWVASPNNIRDFLQTGRTLSNNISLSGGNDNSTFRLSYTNLDQTGIFPNSSLRRNTVAISAGTQLTDKFKVSTKVNYINNNAVGRPATGDWSSEEPVNVLTYWYAWTQRQLDPDRLRNYKSERYRHMTWNVRGPESYNEQSYNNNPYFTLYENYNNDTRDRVYGNLSLEYQLTDAISIKGVARTDFYTERREDRAALGGYLQNAYQEDVIQFREDNYEFLAQYQKNYASDMSLYVNLGANTRRNKFNRNWAKTQNGLSVPNFYNLSASIDRLLTEDVTTERVVNSIYGSASFGYRGLVYLDGSLRNDWSSTLPVDNNSFLYPAISTSLVFSELMPNSGVLSFGKFRASWAQVGNDTDPYRLGLTYNSLTPYESLPVYTVPDILNNSNLKPEITTSYEFGLDMRFFNGIFGFDATYYHNVTRNQIIPLSVSNSTGFDAVIVNAGQVENQGIELMLTATPISTSGGFQWDMNFNWAKNNNKVLALAAGQDNLEVGMRDGVSINARVGEAYGAIIGVGVQKNEDGIPIVDGTGYYQLEPGKVLGNIQPDFTGGFMNTFSYKGLRISALLDFQKGGDVWSETVSNGIANGQFIESVGLNDRGVRKRDPVQDGGGIRAVAVTESGMENQVYLEAQNYLKQYYSIDEFTVYDLSYIKLREVVITYTLPSKWLENSLFQSASFGLVGRNLAILHKNIPHLDPAELAYGSDNAQGLEGAALPAPRNLGFNIRMKF
ncbi:SusC/RagA family TonB-linked outer membrane protein [Catalinimonas sp. 4WD22]|uniref:SusC/RagA family TonB-linked outer membrane protein n=1 Tax=Catalinimonas locisalis TaxID=3133978 RepID=UPI00310192BC